MTVGMKEGRGIKRIEEVEMRVAIQKLKLAKAPEHFNIKTPEIIKYMGKEEA